LKFVVRRRGVEIALVMKDAGEGAGIGNHCYSCSSSADDDAPDEVPSE
jgi:hypothetical protein